jgi:hypothetical protein
MSFFEFTDAERNITVEFFRHNCSEEIIYASTTCDFFEFKSLTFECRPSELIKIHESGYEFVSYGDEKHIIRIKYIRNGKRFLVTMHREYVSDFEFSLAKIKKTQLELSLLRAEVEALKKENKEIKKVVETVKKEIGFLIEIESIEKEVTEPETLKKEIE